MEDKKQANHHHRHFANGTMADGTQFITRVISLPLIQDSISTTQSLANQSKLGRFLLHQTHSMVEKLAYVMHKTQETPSYQHYFRQDGYLQQAIHQVDDWACSSLDIIETKLPLIQQPTATIVDTLIVQPQQQVRSKIHHARETVITEPLSKANNRLNQDLDRLEVWMNNRNLMAKANDVNNNSAPQRALFLGSSVAQKAIGSGMNQANQLKQQGLEWTNYQINHKPLLSQKVVPLIKSIKSHLDASLSKFNQWMHMTMKSTITTESTL
ncbi:hypothetical protein BC941DRAFT_433965 [Chlamydoabsidia padenii]|nr:hypothetical protein BC941DRAFT_433965 [Chlamydoabsidia padenii]